MSHPTERARKTWKSLWESSEKEWRFWRWNDRKSELFLTQHPNNCLSWLRLFRFAMYWSLLDSCFEKERVGKAEECHKIIHWYYKIHSKKLKPLRHLNFTTACVKVEPPEKKAKCESEWKQRGNIPSARKMLYKKQFAVFLDENGNKRERWSITINIYWC